MQPLSPIVTSQARDDSSPLAYCPICQRPITTVKGHRPRRYCSDACKQRAYLEREAHKQSATRRAQLCTTYPHFSENTIDLLDGFAAIGNGEMVERIATTISSEREDWQRGLEHVQQRFADYVRTTNERLSELTGELAKRRQEQERKAKPKMTQAERGELEQARADLKRLSQERSREVEEFHQLSVLFHEQRIQLQAAENHIAQLERSRRVVMLGDLLYEHGQALDFPELWYASPVDDAKQKIIKGEVSWRRFCDRASAQEVKAAYEVAQQLTSNRHGAGE